MGLGKGKKSILESHYPEMFSLRKRGYSYQEITDYLNKKYNMNIWKNQVYSFLKRREIKGILPTVKVVNTGSIIARTLMKNESDDQEFDLFKF